MVRAITYAIYKGITGKFGALQLRPQPAHYYCSECKLRNFEADIHPTDAIPCSDHKMIQREGAIFIEVTSAKEPNVYDWDNKITMALGIVDLGKLIFFLRTAREGDKLSLVHDPGARGPNAGKVVKSLSLDSPKGILAGVFLTASLKEGERLVTHKVPVSGDEATVLGTLFQSFLPKALAWI